MLAEKFTEIDNIKIFHDNIDDHHSDYNAQGLENLFSVEEKHFWFLSRKQFIYENLEQLSLQKSKLIEIGAGTGNVSRHLLKNGFTNIAVGEMHLNGLMYARSYGIKECYQFDLLRSPFKNEFETVCMFDVLEHIENASLALKNVHEMLSDNGYIILTVPAHCWLWSRDDVIAGHKKRYTKRDISMELESNGFELVTARYFFISLIPLLLLRVILNKDNRLPVTQHEYEKEININPTINSILSYICRIENKLNKFLPNWFGGSLFVVGRKK